MSGAKELERVDDARMGVEMVVEGIEEGSGSSWDTVMAWWLVRLTREVGRERTDPFLGL